MKNSLKRWLAIAGAVAWVSPALAGGRELKLEELPQPVRASVESATRGANITSIEQDSEDGKTIYEVEYTKDKVRWELDVAEDGKVLEQHRD